jgi:hypothetical protein
MAKKPMTDAAEKPSDELKMPGPDATPDDWIRYNAVRQQQTAVSDMGYHMREDTREEMRKKEIALHVGQRSDEQRADVLKAEADAADAEAAAAQKRLAEAVEKAHAEAAAAALKDAAVKAVIAKALRDKANELEPAA